MGREKDKQIQEWEQGWRSDGRSICYRCLSDHELSAHVKETATGFFCDFCERSTRKRPSSIDLDSLLEIIGSTFMQYYERAVEQMGWDSEEGGYIGRTYDSDDIIRGQIGGISENADVEQAIVDAFSDEEWCDRDPYSTTGFEAYALSWDRFCRAVKHETRYFFTRRGDRDEDTDLTPVSAMLDELSSDVEQENLIATFDQNTKFVRVRTHRREEKCSDWRSLGSPPPDLAPSNRMSAAGISMFYCSATLATAKAEALSTLGPDHSKMLTASEWSPSRPLVLLNLFDLPKPPSFWFGDRSDRDRVRFLKAFTESISQPVTHDGREHIDYVPSQIVTEYFRHVYRTEEGKHIDGIMFPSARIHKGQNVVIFASSDDLKPTVERMYSDAIPPLILDSSSVRRLRLRR